MAGSGGSDPNGTFCVFLYHRQEELTQQKHQLGLGVQELEVKVHDPSCLRRKEPEAEVL